MRENRDFVVPVNILTPLRAPHFLGPHDTLLCVLISQLAVNIKAKGCYDTGRLKWECEHTRPVGT